MVTTEDHMQQIDQRDRQILNILSTEGPKSRNYLYVATSPACQRTGRTKTIGTYGWQKMDKLVRMGMVTCVTRKPKDWCWAKRCQIRYTYTITQQGRRVLVTV